MTAIIRTSDRNYFKRCRQLWDFTSKIRQNWEPVKRYLAFDFGTAMHAGLEAYYNPKTWGNRAAMQGNAREAFLLSLYELQQKVRVGDIEFERNFDDERDLGLSMLEYYFTWAPKHDNFTPIFNEIEFEIECHYTALARDGGPAMIWVPFLYQGRIDLLVEDAYGYWIIDHKTATQFGDSQWLWLDDQCGSYAWALQKKLGLQVQGVIYNQIKKHPPHPPIPLKYGGFSRNKQQDTTFEVYLKTLRDNGIDPHQYRDILAYFKHHPKEFIRRTKVSYTQQQLEIIGQRIEREARDMLEDPQIYPSPSPMNCNGCRFFAPCTALQEGRDYDLSDNYERRA